MLCYEGSHITHERGYSTISLVCLFPLSSHYGVIFWGNLTAYRKLFGVQNKIFRIITGVKKENLLQ